MSNTGFRKIQLIQCLHDRLLNPMISMWRGDPWQRKRRKNAWRATGDSLLLRYRPTCVICLKWHFQEVLWTFENGFYSHCFQVITVLSFADLEKHGWRNKTVPSDCLRIEGNGFFSFQYSERELNWVAEKCRMMCVMVTKSSGQPVDLRYSASSTLYTF